MQQAQQKLRNARIYGSAGYGMSYNDNDDTSNIISILAGNIPNDNDNNKRVKYSDKPWLNYEEKKFGKLNRQYGFWYQDKNKDYHFSVDDSLKEYTEEEK